MEKELSKTKKCLITGANGVVGMILVNQLLEQGHFVKALVRRREQSKNFPASVEIIEGDVTNKESLKSAVSETEWIFHLAAKLHINNPNENSKQEYERTNIAGTESLLVLAKAHGIEKFIFFSSISVYGATSKGASVDEKSNLNPNGYYAESKAAAEKIVIDSGLGIVLRLAAVYGSRMKGNFVRLLKAVRSGKFVFVGDGLNRRTLIHQEDAARAAIIAAAEARCGSTYNVTDGKNYYLKEIIDVMSQVLGKHPPRVHLPLLPVRVSVGMVEDVCKFVGIDLPLKRNLLEKLLEDVAVNGGKLQKQTSYKPRMNLTDGWRETISNHQIESQIKTLE